MTKPTLKSDMETSTDAGARCPILSFDHLIRSREERGRDREAEGLCRPEVYNQLNLGCLLYRQVSRLAALQNLANVVPYLPVCVVEPGAITNQAACGNELAQEEHGRDCITCSQATICSRRNTNSESLPTRRAPALAVMSFANAESISLSLAALNVKMSCPIACAAARMSSSCVSASGLLGLTRQAITLACGANSRSSSNRFAVRVPDMTVTPVTLPPG